MHGSHPRRNAELTTGRHFYCYRPPSSASSMAQETNRLGSEMAKKGKDPAPDFIRVQHAVVIQKGKDLRALNDLLSVGWRAISTASMRSEEHTSELQSLMRISYAVFCLKKKNKTNN